MNKSASEWRSINWALAQQVVLKYQKLIYAASTDQDMKLVRNIQHKLLHSRHARLLAVRKVTQDNRGKKTAGVDGVKSLSPTDRLSLADTLKVTGRANPVRRIYIPKPGTDEKRPLGIPIMYDRALQALVTMAIEPEWEARFEPNNYGFRPGRNCHDAIKQIKRSLEGKCKYVLDADIAKCFDSINHETLLLKLGLSGKLNKQVKAWLKSGILDGNIFAEIDRGTPQGGVISPLLANIALHGLEIELKEYASTLPLTYPSGKSMSKRDRRYSLSFIRYADDFVVIHENLEVVLQAKEIINSWLLEMGLELKPAKTRIAHTLDENLSEDKVAGFEFLGFNIRHFQSQTKSAKNTRGNKLGYHLLVTPGKKPQIRHQKRISEIIRKHMSSPQEVLISELNPVIRGWSNYFAISDTYSTGTLDKQDFLVFKKLLRWARRRKSKPQQWWSYLGNRSRFMTSNGIYLACHSDSSKTRPTINQYIKVQGQGSPYDGNLTYWLNRLGKFPGLTATQSKLLKEQGYKCNYCQEYFFYGDIIEIDHIQPRSLGGKNVPDNLQLLHSHCHDLKTRLDLSNSSDSSTNKDIQIE